MLTSRGLQTRLPIGPVQCLGHLHSGNVDISADFDEFGQLSNRFCGDNLAIGSKSISLTCCDSNGGIFFSGDRILCTTILQWYLAQVPVVIRVLLTPVWMCMLY